MDLCAIQIYKYGQDFLIKQYVTGNSAVVSDIITELNKFIFLGHTVVETPLYRAKYDGLCPELRIRIRKFLVGSGFF